MISYFLVERRSASATVDEYGHMLRQDVEQALAELERRYGTEITSYVRKVIYSELRARKEDPEEVITVAYIVLDRIKKLYVSELGEFKNYAISALKNEFLKLRHRKELLYEDFVADDETDSPYQVIENDEVWRFQKKPKDSIQKHFDEVGIADSALAVVAVLQTRLTAFEKALIYVMFYSSDDSRKPSLRKFSEDYDISYSKLLTRLKNGLEKLKVVLKDSKIRIDEIQELLR